MDRMECNRLCHKINSVEGKKADHLKFFGAESSVEFKRKSNEALKKKRISETYI